MTAAAYFNGSIGLRGEAELTVAAEHTAAHASGGMLPAVLSTPRLLQLVEDAAYSLAARHLESGYTSVGFEVILDGTDNFEARYLLNDVAVKLGIPWVYGAAVGSYAATMTIRPTHTACLACVFPAPPEGLGETCDTVGVIAPAVAWAAAIQVTETLKLLLGRLRELHGKLMSADIWENRFQEVRTPPDAQCRVCGAREFRYLDGESSVAGMLCGRNAVQIRQMEARALNLAELKKRLAPLGVVSGNEFLVRFELAPFELTIFPDGRAIVKGTDDPAVARGLYAKYVGS